MPFITHHAHRVKSFAGTTTARLSLSYLAIIMLMSIGFSVVFFNTSTHELGRQGPPRDDTQAQIYHDHPKLQDPEIEAFLSQRAAEARHALLIRLITLNAIALVGGSALSYYLARRTLEPIEANMEAQSQFVSDASHELRTPLTALQTTNEVTLRKKNMTVADARDLLQHNVAEVAKLQALTDSLLRLARQDNTHEPFTPISLQEVAGDAMNAIVMKAQAKNITVDDTVPAVRVLGDKTGLVQAVVILLDNAIKYSPDGSKITLAGGQQGKHGDMTVQDTGQGITAQDLPHIFDRFYRADQSRGKQKVDGYGIGLSLAKKIIEQHHGEIIASSVEGKGATFTIKLPLAS